MEQKGTLLKKGWGDLCLASTGQMSILDSRGLMHDEVIKSNIKFWHLQNKIL